ncbi:hypothetical protein MMC24_005306 [Lignoscripta atroalba]|nr:hypothetical protein [Lignoscripta atroalba]
MSLFGGDQFPSYSSQHLLSAQARRINSPESPNDTLLSDTSQQTASFNQDERRLASMGDADTVNQDVYVDGEAVDSSTLGEFVEGHKPISLSLPPRYNKFQGPPSTWRTWTGAERHLAASLEQLRASDLSVHLYNAHVLKRRARNLEKQRVEVKSEPGRSEVWEPPKSWTAWPMEREEIPKVGGSSTESFETEGPTLKNMGRRHEICEELEDILLGLALKEAKSRFLERQPDDDNYNLRNIGEVEDISKLNTSAKSLDPDIAHYESESAVTFAPIKPVVMADDEEARAVLQPTVRHVFTKLNGLLMGLHHARQSYLPTGDDSETQTDLDDESLPMTEMESSNGKRRRQRVKEGKAWQSTGSTAPRSSETGSDIDSPATVVPSASKKRRKSLPPTSRARTRRDRQTRFGNRDWSDVLGVASMHDWDPVVLENVAKRCAALFEEGITFRTLGEGGNEVNDTQVLPKNILEQHEESQDTTDYEKNNTGAKASIHSRRSNGDYVNLYCPVPDCKSSQHIFSRTSNLVKHLNGMHGGLDSSADSDCVEETMVGGVHADGFLEPIRAKISWMRNDTSKHTDKTEHV